MSKRAKKPKSTLTSLAECDRAMRQIALLSIEIEKVEGECDEIVKAAVAHAARRVKGKLERKDQLVNDLAAYFDEHKSELTADGKRTVEMLYGRAGWRLSPGELRIAKGVKVGDKKATWESLVPLVREKLGAEYIRVKESVKKDEVKAASFDDGELLAAGLVIEQADEWWFEIDRARLVAAGSGGERAGGSAAPAGGER